jgi:hypothetical protein
LVEEEEEEMERKVVVVCAVVGFLGVLSAALGFAAEGTRVKVRSYVSRRRRRGSRRRFLELPCYYYYFLDELARVTFIDLGVSAKLSFCLDLAVSHRGFLTWWE